MVAALTPVLIALLSFALRLKDLATPKGYVFDELYYVDAARDYLKYGVEVDGANPEFVVHPPLGKWCIALGMKIFGESEFGWRIGVAIAGTLLILVAARIAHVLFYSPFLTAITAALMAFDGLLLVHSRTALLDLYLSLFILVACYFWLREKFWLSGLFFGAALATKWSAIYFIALFASVVIYRAIRTNRASIGYRILQFGALPLLVYATTWIGWLLSDRGWDRNHSSNPFISLFHYHLEMLNFHTSLTEDHPYQASPWGWLIMDRPTSFFYESAQTCGATKCSQEVLALGTPLLWWAGTLALIFLVVLFVKKFISRSQDKALSFILMGVAAGYLPWFLFPNRTVFNFYSIVFEPFLVLGIVYAIKVFIDHSSNRANVQVISLGFVAAVLIFFIYFLPVFMGSSIPYEAWHARMWLTSWI